MKVINGEILTSVVNSLMVLKAVTWDDGNYETSKIIGKCINSINQVIEDENTRTE